MSFQIKCEKIHIIFLKFSHYLLPAPSGELVSRPIAKYSNALAENFTVAHTWLLSQSFQFYIWNVVNIHFVDAGDES